MSDTSTPGQAGEDDQSVDPALDPAHNKPSQAEGDPGEDVVPATEPAENKPSQAEGNQPRD